MVNFVQVIFLIVTFLMVIAILMQSTKSDGLGAGFGAMGGTQIFGGRGPSDFLKKFTTYIAIIYGVLVIWLSILYRTDTNQLQDNPLLNPTQTEQSAPATDQLDSSSEPVLGDTTSN